MSRLAYPEHRMTFRKPTSVAALSCLVFAFFGLAGCDSAPPPPATETQPAASVASAPAKASAAPREGTLADAMRGGGDDVQPVYPITKEPPLPEATKLCTALHALPAARRAACCSGTPSLTQQGECERMLSTALRDKAVVVPEAGMDACVKAMEKRHEGCEWVNIGVPPPAAECQGIIQGQLDEKAVCRSSLECKEGLACLGVGPTIKGTCGKPKANGTPCGGTVDALAGATRQTRTSLTHGECEGSCTRRRCEERKAEGSPCKADFECGENRYCGGGKCSDKAPRLGAPCSQTCEGDARCVAAKCVAPKKAGEACDSDRECMGACEKGDAGPGKCGMRCAMPIHW